MAFTSRKFQGAGIVSMRPYGTTQALVDVGDVSTAVLGQETEQKSLPNLRGGGGNSASTQRVTKRSLKLGFQDWCCERVLMAMKGTATAIPAGAVAAGTPEVVTAKLGGIIRLAYVDPTSIVVKKSDDSVTYSIANGDYTLTHNGIEIPATGSDIVDGQSLNVSYSYSAQSLIEAFTASDTYWEVHIDGLNDAETGDKYTIDFWKWQPSVPDSLDLLHTDYAILDIEGELLTDSTKGSGVSAIMRLKQTTGS
jgi:uncharacterized Zn-binding protein involved in type VI secretion